MLTSPNGRDPVEIENERLQNETVQRALSAVQTRSGGTSGTLSSGAAPQGAGLSIGGVSLKGKLGFAFGFSGFGGPDYLFPPSRESEIAPRAFWELS